MWVELDSMESLVAKAEGIRDVVGRYDLYYGTGEPTLDGPVFSVILRPHVASKLDTFEWRGALKDSEIAELRERHKAFFTMFIDAKPTHGFPIKSIRVRED